MELFQSFFVVFFCQFVLLSQCWPPIFLSLHLLGIALGRYAFVIVAYLPVSFFLAHNNRERLTCARDMPLVNGLLIEVDVSGFFHTHYFHSVTSLQFLEIQAEIPLYSRNCAACICGKYFHTTKDDLRCFALILHDFSFLYALCITTYRGQHTNTYRCK